MDHHTSPDARDGTPPLPEDREPSPALSEIPPTPPRLGERVFNYADLFPDPPARAHAEDNNDEVIDSPGPGGEDELGDMDADDPNVSDICPPHPCQLRRPAHDTYYPIWYAAIEGRKVGIYSRWDFREDMTETEAIRSGRVQRYPAWDFAYTHYCINYFERQVKILEPEDGTPTPTGRGPAGNANARGARRSHVVHYQPLIFLVTKRQAREPIPQPNFAPAVVNSTSAPSVPANPTSAPTVAADSMGANPATVPATSQQPGKGKDEVEVIEVSSDDETEEPAPPPKKKAKLTRKRAPRVESASDSEDYVMPKSGMPCICNCHTAGIASAQGAAGSSTSVHGTTSSNSVNGGAGPSSRPYYTRVYRDPSNRSSAATRVVRRYYRDGGGKCDDPASFKSKYLDTDEDA